MFKWRRRLGAFSTGGRGQVISRKELLPEVISGASARSIIAALVWVRALMREFNSPLLQPELYFMKNSKNGGLCRFCQDSLLK